MKNIGDILRKTREEKGYSLVDMQRETKLQQRYLSALENNQLDSLPGDIYYDSFVRQYAQALGLDGDDLLADREAQLSDETPSIVLSDDGIHGPAGDWEEENSRPDEPLDYEAQRQAASEKLMESLKEEEAAQEKNEGAGEDIPEDEAAAVPVTEEPVSDWDHLDQVDREKAYTQNPIVNYERNSVEDKQADEEPEPSFFKRYGCSIFTLLLLILTALLLFFYFNSNSGVSNEPLETEQSQESSLEEETSDPASEPAEESVEEEEPAEETAPEVTIEQIEADGSNGIYRMDAGGADEFMVAISAEGDSAWVSIESDGQQLRQGVVEEGDTMEVPVAGDASTIVIQAGNAEATSIEINGSALEFPTENVGSPTQVLTINIE